MYITYHQQIIKPSKITNTIPLVILCKELQDKLKEWNVIQKRYFFFDNGFYWFLYLDNGDRVDIEI
jgi:hypothetical protein